MSLTQLAIRRNRVTLVLVGLLLASGILAYSSLPKEKDPGFIVRTAVITSRLPGASPERMELLVTDKIEKKVQEMPEVDFVSSESRTG
ncbi:MAG: efflux RND transporter permease subunit, partial [Acidobacteriota bacterium]